MARKKRSDPASPRLGLKIELGVPVKKRRHHFKPVTEAGELARDIPVGGSIWAKKREDIEPIRLAMHYLKKKSTFTEDEKDGQWGYRIWRLPDEGG